MIDIYPTKLLNDTNNGTPLINKALTRTQNSFLLLCKSQNNRDFYHDVYKNLDTQTQMLFHMDFLVNLFEEYRILINQKYNTNLPLVSVEKYQKMSKIHRGAFKPYDKNYYILNSHKQNQQTILSIKKGSNQETKSLFDKAACLLIQKFSIENINELYSTFAEIDKNISLHKNRIVLNNYKNDPIQNRHGAWDIYTEYQDELTHKDFYTKAQKLLNEEKIAQIRKLKNNRLRLKALQNLSNIVMRSTKYQQIILDTKVKVLKNAKTQKIL